MIYNTFDLDTLTHSRGGNGRLKPNPKDITPLIDFCVDHITKESVVLETGCFFAVSTLIFAHFAKEVHTVDIGFCTEASNVIRNSGYNNIIKITDDSAKVARRLAKKQLSFDVIYLDALHTEEHVTKEITSLVPLIKPGGIISGHDYTIEGVRNAVNKCIGEPDKVYADSSWMKKLPV